MERRTILSKKAAHAELPTRGVFVGEAFVNLDTTVYAGKESRIGMDLGDFDIGEDSEATRG